MVNFERDHEGVTRYESELLGPLDGCHMKIAYFPDQYELAGMVELTLNDNETKEEISQLKARVELDHIEKKGEEYEVVAKFGIKELHGGFGLMGGSGGVTTTAENYKLEMMMLCSWFMGQWMTKCRWKDFIFSGGEEAEWVKQVDGWVGSSKMESFFGEGKAYIKGGFGLSVEHKQMLSDGKGGWFKVILETADGVAEEVKGVLSKAEIGVKWVVSDEVNDTSFSDKMFEGMVEESSDDGNYGLSESKKMCLYLGVRYLRQHYGKVEVVSSKGDENTGLLTIDEKVLAEESTKWIGF